MAGVVGVAMCWIIPARVQSEKGFRCNGTDGLGVGGGVYNLGTFLHDAATVIHHNRASDTNDDCFDC
jgi:hypothetical protein